MTTRRSFLGAAGAASALALLARGLHAAWLGTRTGADRIPRIGLQLYTVRSEMERSVEQTIAAVAGAGYKEVEFAGYFGRDPAALRALLDRHGLTAPSAHVRTPNDRRLRPAWMRPFPRSGRARRNTPPA